MADGLALWQKIQEIAPSRHGHDANFLKEHIGSNIGVLTIQTLAEKVLGVIQLGGNVAATLVMHDDGLGRSGGEVYRLAFYDERPPDPPAGQIA